MEYCLRLRFEEEPDYSYLRKLFKFPGSIDWNDKHMELKNFKKIKPKDKISDSGLDTPGTSMKARVYRSMRPFFCTIFYFSPIRRSNYFNIPLFRFSMKGLNGGQNSESILVTSLRWLVGGY